MAGREFQIGNVSLFTVKKDYSYLCMWTTLKLAGKNQNLDPMWRVLIKEVDLGEPTSFLDRVYLGCTQRKCEISKDIVDNYRTMFESRISAGGLEKKTFPQNLRISSWSYANKTTQQLNKVSTPCTDDHHFKKEETNSVGDCQKYHLKLF